MKRDDARSIALDGHDGRRRGPLAPARLMTEAAGLGSAIRAPSLILSG
ncbi:MAG: hypothetical protein VB101_05785 [Rhodospirillaceae bacterium]|nr:hypothetical protein [Rhodospirillaceae bacterium]